MVLLFEFASVGFWLMIFVISIIMIAFLENSKSPGSWCTFTVLATFAALYWLGSGATLKELWFHIEHNILQTLIYFVFYILVGIVWSFVEWRWYVAEKADKFRRSGKTGDMNVRLYMPTVGENKARLSTWIFYWPWSVLWFVSHKPIETLYKEILKVTTRVYNKITESAFKEFKK